MSLMTREMIREARRNLPNAQMQTSARLCLSVAVRAHDRGDYDSAQLWALKSLRYSVGVFDPAYQRASK